MRCTLSPGYEFEPVTRQVILRIRAILGNEQRWKTCTSLPHIRPVVHGQSPSRNHMGGDFHGCRAAGVPIGMSGACHSFAAWANTWREVSALGTCCRHIRVPGRNNSSVKKQRKTTEPAQDSFIRAGIFSGRRSRLSTTRNERAVRPERASAGHLGWLGNIWRVMGPQKPPLQQKCSRVVNMPLIAIQCVRFL